MSDVIIAAIIGGSATIAATIVANISKKKNEQNKTAQKPKYDSVITQKIKGDGNKQSVKQHEAVKTKIGQEVEGNNNNQRVD